MSIHALGVYLSVATVSKRAESKSSGSAVNLTWLQNITNLTEGNQRSLSKPPTSYNACYMWAQRMAFGIYCHFTYLIISNRFLLLYLVMLLCCSCHDQSDRRRLAVKVVERVGNITIIPIVSINQGDVNQLGVGGALACRPNTFRQRNRRRK